jgi:hypothetical protein
MTTLLSPPLLLLSFGCGACRRFSLLQDRGVLKLVQWEILMSKAIAAVKLNYDTSDYYKN